MSDVKYPLITVDLVGRDGNAYAIMGRVVGAMIRARLTPAQIKEFQDEAMAGNYDHLLQTVMRYVNVE